MSEHNEDLLQKIYEKVSKLEEKVSKLEDDYAKLSSKEPPRRPVTPQPKPVSQAETATSAPKHVSPPSRPTPTKPKGKPIESYFTFENIIALLPKLFMLMIIFSLIWVFKLMSDNGVISEAFKVVIGYALGGAFFGYAYWRIRKFGLPDRKNKIFVISFTAGAYLAWLITTFAGVAMYGVLSTFTGLVALGLILAFALYWSDKLQAESFTLMLSITGFILPYLLVEIDIARNLVLGFTIVLYGLLMYSIIKHKLLFSFYVSSFMALLTFFLTGEMTNIVYGMLLLFSLVAFFAYALYYEANKHDQKTIYMNVLFIYTLGLVVGFTGLSLEMIDAKVYLLLFGIIHLVFLGLVKTKVLPDTNHNYIGVFSFLLLFTGLLELSLFLNNSSPYMFFLLILTSSFGLLLSVRLKNVVNQAFNFALYVFTNITVLFDYFNYSQETALELVCMSLTTGIVCAVWFFLTKSYHDVTIDETHTFVDKLFIRSNLYSYVSILFVIYFTATMEALEYKLYTTTFFLNELPLLFIGIYAFGFVVNHFAKQVAKPAYVVSIVSVIFMTMSYFAQPFLTHQELLLSVPCFAAIVLYFEKFIVKLQTDTGEIFSVQKGNMKTPTAGYIICYFISIILLHAYMTLVSESEYIFSIEAITHWHITLFKSLIMLLFTIVLLYVLNKKEQKALERINLIVFAISLFVFTMTVIDGTDLLVRIIVFATVGSIGMYASKKIVYKDKDLDK